MKCVNSIPLEKDDAVEVSESLQGLVKLYSFGDLVKNSGPPYNIRVDLKQGLRNITDNVHNFANDYQFQKALINLFNPLFDAHTLYRMPKSYSKCVFVRPFLIESMLDENNGRQTFHLRQGILGDLGDEVWEKLFLFKPKDFVDQEVVSIQRTTPVSYFEWFANNFVGYYKDPSVRLNAALRRRWGQVPANLFPLDEGLDLTTQFILKNGRDIKVPNAIMCQAGFTGTDDFIRNNKRSSVQEFSTLHQVEEYSERVSRGYIDPHQEMDLFKQFNMVQPSRTPSQDIHNSRVVRSISQEDGSVTTNIVTPNADNVKVISHDKSNETFYMTYTDEHDNITPVFKLTTFLPQSVRGSLEVLNELLDDAKKNDYDNVIIDMSYNGGGIVCLADLVAAVFVEKWGNLSSSNPNAPLGLYDFRKSDITDEFTTDFITWQSFTNPSKYMEPKSRKVYSDMSFYRPGLNHTRGGLTSGYTEKSLFPASCIGYPSYEYPNFAPVRHFFKKVIFLTDGACGSACSLILSQLQSVKGATVVSYGGVKGKSVGMETSSFAGGNVLEWVTVTNVMHQTGNQNYPKRFPTSATARFNYHEYYLTNTSVLPREFERIPADYHLDTWSSLYMWDPLSEEGRSQLSSLYAPTLKTVLKK